MQNYGNFTYHSFALTNCVEQLNITECKTIVSDYFSAKIDKIFTFISFQDVILVLE